MGFTPGPRLGARGTEARGRENTYLEPQLACREGRAWLGQDSFLKWGEQGLNFRTCLISPAQWRPLRGFEQESARENWGGLAGLQGMHGNPPRKQGLTVRKSLLQAKFLPLEPKFVFLLPCVRGKERNANDSPPPSWH